MLEGFWAAVPSLFFFGGLCGLFHETHRVSLGFSHMEFGCSVILATRIPLLWVFVAIFLTSSMCEESPESPNVWAPGLRVE